MLLALVAGLVLAPLVTWWLHRRAVLDVPNDRSSHAVPVPRGGGLAIAMAATMAAALIDAGPEQVRLAFAAGPLAFGLLGMADDLAPIAARHRLGIQVVLAAGTTVLLTDHLSGPVAWQLVFTVAVAVWLIAYVNAFNFMDGINGLAVVTAMIGGATWWWLGELEDVTALRWSGAVLAVACVGFLPFNFPRARVFLGDVGSYFIGAWCAAVVVVGLRAGLPPEAVLAPVAIFLADTAVTLISRFRRGEPITVPHRDHRYQRLVAQGRSHAQITVAIALATAGCGLFGILATAGGAWRAGSAAGIALVLLGYLRADVLLAPRR